MISAYTLSTYIVSFDDLKIVCVGDLSGRVTRVFPPVVSQVVRSSASPMCATIVLEVEISNWQKKIPCYVQMRMPLSLHN